MKRNRFPAPWLLGMLMMLTFLPGGCPTSPQALGDLSTTVAGEVAEVADAVRNAIDDRSETAAAREDDEEDDGADEDDGDEDGCLELVLPVTFVLPDGSQLVIEGEYGWAMLDAWYDVYEDEEEGPELQFPVDVIFEGETITVQDDDELYELEMVCYGEDDEHYEECFEPVLPITFVLPDGMIAFHPRSDYNGNAGFTYIHMFRIQIVTNRNFRINSKA